MSLPLNEVETKKGFIFFCVPLYGAVSIQITASNSKMIDGSWTGKETVMPQIDGVSTGLPAGTKEVSNETQVG
jgi:hypothetical protein